MVWLLEPLFSQFDVQSHHHHFSVSAFRAILIAFSVSAFRAIVITFQYRRSEPSSSHFQLRRSEPSLLSIGVQSHRYHFSVSAFRAISIASQYRRLEPSLSLLSIGVQSHFHRFSVSTFRAILITFLVAAFRAITSQYRRSEPSSLHFQLWRSEPSLLSIGVQSHRYHFSVSAFRAIIITSQYQCLEPLHSFVSAVFGLPGSCVCWWMIRCRLIFWSITFDAILGHISVMDEICRPSRSYMLILTCGVCAEMMTFSLFHDDPLVEPR